MVDDEALRAPRLCIFVKEPKPGRAKTRLAAGVGDARATDLARAFFVDTLAMATAQPSARVVVVLDGDEAGLPTVPAGVEVWPQGEGDLGARLERCLKRALVDARAVVVIGTDSPGLPSTRIGAAFEVLRSADAVIGPAEDGGFYLLGVTRCPDGALADLPWSTRDTCARTLSRLSRLQMPVALLSSWFDVDELADLARLSALLSTGAVIAPATAQVLGFEPTNGGA